MAHRLPVRIVQGAVDAPCLSIDGAFGAAGLNLSHWPGNATPERFRHDLSTGSALRFAALPAAEREELTAGFASIVNNHYDTDGTCALFAVAHPERALPHADALLAAARAGDFFEVPSEDAFCVDCVVTGLSDPKRSPLAEELAPLDSLGRWNRATAYWMEHLDALVAGDLEAYRTLWEAPLEALRADQSDLEQSQRSDDDARDTTRFVATRGFTSSRDPRRSTFDPGRHALFAATRADRVWAIAPSSAGGTTYRLVLSTRSWFDLAEPRATPRPDLAQLAEELNQLESCDPGTQHAWHTQSPTGASPELWFGRPDQPLYAEHNDRLAPSQLHPVEVAAAFARASAR